MWWAFLQRTPELLAGGHHPFHPGGTEGNKPYPLLQCDVEVKEVLLNVKALLRMGDLKKSLKMKEKKIKLKIASTQIEKGIMQTKKLNQNQSEKKLMFNKEGKIIYGKLDFSEDGMEDKKKSEFSGKNYKNLLKKAEQKKNKIEKLREINPEKAVKVEERENGRKLS
ncbi:hypothetical protein TNCV_5124591 [Trichonephila clavipes]|nr:hypothetical protein TNCV_5124591 [Trichonephila clavipes]